LSADNTEKKLKQAAPDEEAVAKRNKNPFKEPDNEPE